MNIFFFLLKFLLFEKLFYVSCSFILVVPSNKLMPSCGLFANEAKVRFFLRSRLNAAARGGATTNHRSFEPRNGSHRHQCFVTGTAKIIKKT